MNGEGLSSFLSRAVHSVWSPSDDANGNQTTVEAVIRSGAGLVVRDAATANDDQGTATAVTAEDGNLTSNTIWMAIVLVMILTCLCCCQPYHMLRLMAEERRRNAERERERRLKNPVIRRPAIDKCLIVKRVISSDGNGNLRLGDFVQGEDQGEDPPETVSSSSSSSDESQEEGQCDDEESECMICLEPFRVGDVVAWSKSGMDQETASPAIVATAGGDRETSETSDASAPKQQQQSGQKERCLHVFHRECITMWLQQQTECPSCRTAMLSFDKSDYENEGDEDDAYMNHKSDGGICNSSTSFVIMHGLVYSLTGGSVGGSPFFRRGQAENELRDELSSDDDGSTSDVDEEATTGSFGGLFSGLRRDPKVHEKPKEQGQEPITSISEPNRTQQRHSRYLQLIETAEERQVHEEAQVVAGSSFGRSDVDGDSVGDSSLLERSSMRHRRSIPSSNTDDWSTGSASMHSIGMHSMGMLSSSMYSSGMHSRVMYAKDCASTGSGLQRGLVGSGRGRRSRRPSSIRTRRASLAMVATDRLLYTPLEMRRPASTGTRAQSLRGDFWSPHFSSSGRGNLLGDENSDNMLRLWQLQQRWRERSPSFSAQVEVSQDGRAIIPKRRASPSGTAASQPPPLPPASSTMRSVSEAASYSPRRFSWLEQQQKRHTDYSDQSEEDDILLVGKAAGRSTGDNHSIV